MNTVTQVAVVPLSELRTDLVKSAKKTGQVIKAYADGLSSAFDLVDNEGNVTSKWYELKGKLKAGIKDERKLFDEAFKAEGLEKVTIFLVKRWRKQNGQFRALGFDFRCANNR